VDGVPAFSKEAGFSLKPGGLMCVSLAPAERGKMSNMILYYVMPTSIKGESQRKYFNFFAEYELNDLFTNGRCMVTQTAL
jgi:hypothetical protein